MAYRLVNRSRQPIAVDLRGGETLVLAPGGVSAPLREELLYDNPYLREWQAAGLLQRVHARFDEVLAAEHAAQAAAADYEGAHSKQAEPHGDEAQHADHETAESEDGKPSKQKRPSTKRGESSEK